MLGFASVADALSIGITFFEVFLLAVAGFFAGKIVHGLSLAFLRRFSAKTTTTLDNYLVTYIENPLKVIVILFFVYIFSYWIDGLSGVKNVMSQYALAILVLTFSYLLAEVVGALFRWYYEEGQKKVGKLFSTTWIPFLRKISRILIVAIGFASALSIAGIDLSGVLTVTSVLMLIIGLASQESLANIFAGMALQLDRPFEYGDYLQFLTGEIAQLKRIGTRTTRLQTLEGNQMLVTNSEFAKQRVSKISTNNFVRLSITLEIPNAISSDAIQAHLEQFVSKQPSATNAQVRFFFKRVQTDHYTLQCDLQLALSANLSQIQSDFNREALHFITRKNQK